MKTPKFIIKGLVSGRVKFTPELLEVLKKHRAGVPADAHEDSPRTERPEAPNTETPSSDNPPSCRGQRRMMFVSPLPGRWIRSCAFVLGGVVLLSFHLAQAAGRESAFDSANRSATEGRTADAVRAYEEIIARHGYSAPVLFNLANAECRAGQLGQAILNYERAQWLAPQDPDIAANLSVARQKAGLQPDMLSSSQRLAHCLSWTTWSCLAATLLVLVAAALPLRQIWPKARQALTAAAAVGTLAFAIALGAIALRWSDLDRAIVTAAETPARVSPVTVVQPLFTLHAGEPVMVKKLHGPFALITNSHGREGWVSRDAIAKVVPSAPRAS